MSDVTKGDLRAIQLQITALESKVDKLTKMIKNIENLVSHIHAYQK